MLRAVEKTMEKHSNRRVMEKAMESPDGKMHLKPWKTLMENLPLSLCCVTHYTTVRALFINRYKFTTEFTTARAFYHSPYHNLYHSPAARRALPQPLPQARGNLPHSAAEVSSFIL